MTRVIAFLQLMLLVSFLGSTYGATIKVPTDQPTIQAGINTAVAGDTVMVAAGIYNEDIVLKSGVIVQGAGADTTTIHGTGAGPVILASGVDASAKIDGFKITGSIHDFYGGGISCIDNSSPTISNNVIVSNGARYGGGVFCAESSPTISHNVIRGNNATSHGGGIYCLYSSPTISDNLIEKNTGSVGGAIVCDQHSSPSIINNVISQNAAESGAGGISCIAECAPDITNNIISGNSVSSGTGGISAIYRSSPRITDNAITNNSAFYGTGGISLSVYSHPLIANNEIMDNTAIRGSGGISCGIYSSPGIMNNTIKGNSTIFGNGGGIYCYRSSPTIMNNEIVANSAGSDGGGIECVFYSYPAIIGNRIMGNSAGYGGGIGCFVSAPVVTNNLIVGNSAQGGGGIYGMYSWSTVTNCIIWGNGDDLVGCRATYSCIEDGDAGENNISLHPRFVDAANGDYRLRALSPCIDAGKNLTGLPSTDLLGNPRVVDGNADDIPIVDMGPYEYLPMTIVEIDIKPGSEVNPINLRSKGVIPVALITTDDFDAWDADVSTITFGPDGASPVHVSSDDADGDGDLDMVLHFRQQDTGICLTDISASLQGRTGSNAPFAGKDIVKVITRHQK